MPLGQAFNLIAKWVLDSVVHINVIVLLHDLTNGQEPFDLALTEHVCVFKEDEVELIDPDQ